MASEKKSVFSVDDDSSSDEELSVVEFRNLVLEKCAAYERHYNPELAALQKQRRYETKVLLPRVRSPRPDPVKGPLEWSPHRPAARSFNPHYMEVAAAKPSFNSPTCPIGGCAMKINQSMLLWHFVDRHADCKLYGVHNGALLRLQGNYAKLPMDTNVCMGIIAYNGESNGKTPYESGLAALNYVDNPILRQFHESLPMLVLVRKALGKSKRGAKCDGQTAMTTIEQLIIWISGAVLQGSSVYFSVQLMDANMQSLDQQHLRVHHICSTEFPQAPFAQLTLDNGGVKQLYSASAEGVFHLSIKF